MYVVLLKDIEVLCEGMIITRNKGTILFMHFYSKKYYSLHSYADANKNYLGIIECKQFIINRNYKEVKSKLLDLIQ